MKIPKEIMTGILENRKDIVQNNIVDNSRWSIIHEIIFKYNDKHYQAYYSVGATECQDESPWEGMDEVDVFEVTQVAKTVLSWEPI